MHRTTYIYLIDKRKDIRLSVDHIEYIAHSYTTKYGFKVENKFKPRYSLGPYNSLEDLAKNIVTEHPKDSIHCNLMPYNLKEDERVNLFRGVKNVKISITNDELEILGDYILQYQNEMGVDLNIS